MALDQSDMTSGAAREFVRNNRTRAILFAALCLSIVGIGYGNDYQSCQRSEAIRSALRYSFTAQAQRAKQRAAVETGVDRTTDLEAMHAAMLAAARVSPLDCGAIPPPT